jgi:hypothetical protein
MDVAMQLALRASVHRSQASEVCVEETNAQALTKIARVGERKICCDFVFFS